ncbi:MAG: ribosome small subunit-dependent GTPase A [Prolixibacteraceae bacterium]|nr:ribosome small subunit-dependent GTPase A [Prolixibacteraceae bacterium]
MKTGVVIKSTGSWYSVKIDSEEIIDCKIKGTFRMKNIRSTNPVAVGDHVNLELAVESNAPASGNHTGIITEILERKNYIIRKSPNLSKESQILVCNVDHAFLVVTINFPVTTTTFIDRFLVTAEAYQIPCTLVFNKIDRYNLEQKSRMNMLIDLYKEIGYTCIITSAKEKKGLDVLKNMMKNKINVFSGHSGVGKSTLINIIEPDLDLKTDEISTINKTGKHTTTFSEMYPLHFGGYIVDTPGIKGFGVLNMKKEEIGRYFPEILKRMSKCQYSNCTHTHEPGCEIKKALKENEIAESRYHSYLGLLEDDERYRY